MNQYVGYRNPLGVFERDLVDVMNAFTSGLVPSRLNRVSNQNQPALNIWENEECLFVEAEVPGLKMSEVEISIAANELSLRLQAPKLPTEGKVHRKERATQAAFRIVRLPYPIESGKVEAILKNGVLTIRLPKAEAVKPRKITVQSL